MKQQCNALSSAKEELAKRAGELAACTGQLQAETKLRSEAAAREGVAKANVARLESEKKEITVRSRVAPPPSRCHPSDPNSH